MIKDVTGVLLAGGQSKRMGRDKRFIQLEGISLFARVLDTLKNTFEQVIVVVAKHGTECFTEIPQVVEDVIPNCGSAGGIYSGLIYSATDRIFCIACDMPFLNSTVASYLCSIDPYADIVMAQVGGKLHPMHAVYSKRCLPALKHKLEEKDLQIHTMCNNPELAVKIVPETDIREHDPYGLSFYNINTPMDLEFAQKLKEKQNATT